MLSLLLLLPAWFATPQSFDEALVRRFDAHIASSEMLGADATARALQNEGAAALEWLVALRLGRAESRALWNADAHAAAAQALRAGNNAARDVLLRQLETSLEPKPLAAAMGVLAELGDERDLEQLLRWAALLAPQALDDDLEHAGAAPLRASVAKLASLACRSAHLWQARIEQAPQPLREAVLRGLADSGAPDALERLAETLGRELVSDSFTLVELARATRGSDRRHAENLRQRVRPLLTASDLDVRRDAALCLGALGDEASAETLVALLTHEHAGVRANAHWALARLTGRSANLSADAWGRWIRSELDWWREDAPLLLDRLVCTDPKLRVQAAHALAQHRFPRHSLAVALAERLPVNDAAASAAVLAALVQLRSQTAADVLEQRAPEARGTPCAERLATSLAALRSQERGRATPGVSH
jgi:hypothetical protein